MLSPSTMKIVRESGAVPQADYLLDVEGVRKAFPGVVALDNVQFRLKRGTVHALMGENGAGKSTLMKIIAGVYTPDQGEFRLRGVPIRLEFAARRSGERHRHDPSGVEPDAFHDGRREYLDQARTEKCSRLHRSRRASPQDRKTARRSEYRHRSGDAGRSAEHRQPADDRDRQGGVFRIRRSHHGRADLGIDGKGGRPPLCDHPRSQEPGQRHRLHHA